MSEEYFKIKKVSEKATASAVAFFSILNSVLVLHLRCGCSSVSLDRSEGLGGLLR